MLDYQSPKPTYVPTPQDSPWRRRRLGYYAGQVLLFLVMVYRIGPNLILFHSLFTPSPSHYVQYTNEYVPIIAAIKRYQQDFNQLPVDSMLPPEYMPPNYDGTVGEINSTTSITFVVGRGDVLEYEFSPAKEGWIIHSPRYNGPIPAPIVQTALKPVMPPSSAPTTVTSNGI